MQTSEVQITVGPEPQQRQYQQQQHNLAAAPLRLPPPAAVNRRFSMASNDYCFRLNWKRICWFILSHITFYLALLCASRKTQLYISINDNDVDDNDEFHIVVFYTSIIVHEVFLFGLLFSPFDLDEAFRGCSGHFLWKSLGELVFMIVASLLLMKETTRRGEIRQHHDLSEVAMLLSTYALLNLDALCIINLLRPSHHYSIFEITAALTVHLCVKLQRYAPALSWFVIAVVFFIILIKNYLWRNVHYRDNHRN